MLLCLVQIVLNTDPSAGDMRDNLNYIYFLYVEYVMKNPLYIPGQPFRYIFPQASVAFPCLESAAL